MYLETERLIIREFEENDLEAVHEYASDPLVTRYLLWESNSKQDTSQFIEWMIGYQHAENRISFELVMLLKHNHKLIGACGIEMKERNGEIGYTLHRDYWGQGYATEASQAMLELGFNQLGLHRIYATCRPDNIGSAKVLMKIGMTKEGFLREHYWRKNKYHSSFLFSILAQEYREKYVNDKKIIKLMIDK